MAPRDEKRKFKPSENFVSFTAPSTSTATTTTAVPVRLDPAEFERVPRPDVPTTEEQRPPAADESFLGRVASVADRYFPDDLGGALRGESGWLANVPGYRQTVGAVADVGLDAGGAVVDAINWGSDQMNHLGSALVSWLPGGIQTLDWDQAQRVSFGQSLVGSMGATAGRLKRGEALASDLVLLPFALMTVPLSNIDSENEAQQAGFNILDDEQRKAAFDDGAGQFFSGFSDAAWLVGADPTIVGGKATSILRYGTKAGKFGGLSNQTLNTIEKVDGYARRLDSALDGYKQTGRMTGELENVRALISTPLSMLENNPLVKGANNQTLLMRLADMVDPEDLDTGVALVKAAAGHKSGWAQLRQRNIQVYDQLALGLGVDPVAPLPGRLDQTEDQIRYLREYIDEVQRMTDEGAPDLVGASRQETLAAAVDDVDAGIRPDVAAGQLITRGGSRGPAGMVRAANAYRRGALRDDFGRVERGPRVTRKDPVLPKSQWVEETIEAFAGSRPVAVVRWFGKGTPNGIVNLKGQEMDSARREVASFLRRSSIDPTEAARIYDDFVRAATPEARQAVVQRMELAEATALGAKYGDGMSAEAAQALYNSYAQARGRHLATLKNKDAQFAYDQQTGTPVLTPQFYTDLDQAFPLINQRVFKRVIQQNHKWMRSLEDVTLAADTINTYWKLSVLLRLGYTQRNVGEGAMRSLAVLGMVAANPQAWAALPSNTYWYARTLGLRRRFKADTRALTTSYDNLQLAKQNLLDARAAARVDEMFDLRKQVAEADREIRRLSSRKILGDAPKEQRAAQVAALREESKSLTAEITRLARKKTRTPAEQRRLDSLTRKKEKITGRIRALSATGKDARELQRQIDRLISKRDSLRAKADKIEMDDVAPYQPLLTGLQAEEARLLARVDDLSAQTQATIDRLRARNAKRKLGGTQANVMAGGEEYDGAFQGPEGDIARLLSSADATAYQTFDIGFEARRAAMAANMNYVKYDPRALPKGVTMADYFDEYATRLNQRFRNDTLIKMWLRADPDPAKRASAIADAKKWLMSDQGSYYRNTMSINGRRLESPQGAPIESAIDDYLTESWNQFAREIPADSGLRARLLEDAVTPGEVAAALRGRQLPIIPGRAADAPKIPNTFVAVQEKVSEYAGTLMRYLGSMPETKLLRHPFYNAVYKRRQNELYALAASQGQDMASAAVKARIVASARRDALNATRSTMYTIERYSNASEMLRFVSPFFPAFENSLRTWGRIAYENPAVLGYGNILWNIPANLGWVVDPRTGERVEKSNMFKDEGNYIIWPQPIADFFAKDTPFTPGEALMTYQQGFNLVFPGSEFWFPGVGPMTQIPVALVLRGRPETADVIRSLVDREMFAQIVPQGNPNADLLEAILPTWARRLKQMWAGTNDDGAYLTLLQTMVEDAYIDAQLNGTTVTPQDMKKIEQRAASFWSWQVGAAGTLPVQSKFASKYEVQRSFWNTLIDDTSLSYDQKLAAFQEKFPGFGDALLPIMRSGSTSAYGLQPNLSTWQKIYKNPDLVSQLNSIDPQLVGMFGNMGSWDDPFSYSVYGEFQNMTIGRDGRPIRDRMDPNELLRNNEIADGWRQWTQISDVLDEKAKAAGFSSIRAKGAEEFLALADEYERDLKTQYPAWGQEKEIYRDRLPAFIVGARILVDNATLVEEDTTISALREYMEIRDYVAERKSLTKDEDARKELDQIAIEAAAELRDSDIGFADFYDRYLADDDFRVV